MSRRGEFRVSVSKDYLVFASAHFITFAGHRCEGLHGHNYRARVTIEGGLDEEAWFVFDFVALKKLMRGLCDAIDHKVLLPLHNPKVQVVEDGDTVTGGLRGQAALRFPARGLRAAAGDQHHRRDAGRDAGGSAGGRAEAAGREGPDGDRDGSRGEHRPGGDVSSQDSSSLRLRASGSRLRWHQAIGRRW